jgi:hypothetical protein
MSSAIPAAAGSSSTNTIAPAPPTGNAITPTTGVTSATQGTGLTSTPVASPSSILNNLGTATTSADPTVDPGTALLIPDDLEILPWSPSMFARISNADGSSRWYTNPGTTDECGPGDPDCYHVVPFSPAYLASMRHYNDESEGGFAVEPMTSYYAALPQMPTETQIEGWAKKYWWVLLLGLGLVLVTRI